MPYHAAASGLQLDFLAHATSVHRNHNCNVAAQWQNGLGFCIRKPLSNVERRHVATSTRELESSSFLIGESSAQTSRSLTLSSLDADAATSSSSSRSSGNDSAHLPENSFTPLRVVGQKEAISGKERPPTGKTSTSGRGAPLSRVPGSGLPVKKALASSTAGGIDATKEAHKNFDQVVISVRAGDGGNGALLRIPRPIMPGRSPGQKGKVLEKRPKFKEARKKLRQEKFKRDADGGVILPMGGGGGDVVLVADESIDTLLPLHGTKKLLAGSGGNVDSKGGLARRSPDGRDGEALLISVPVGTVVKRKRGGQLLADLCRAGDKILVARGGRGGISILHIPENNGSHLQPINPPKGATVTTSATDKQFIFGLPGEEVTLELTLRVVADVGLLGLPNAGKSSLLAALTAAQPQIAPYPFTTLMPNLGRIDGDPLSSDGGFALGPTLADLPGIIEGAHVGRGLGRMFLRHLRRTRVIVHVIDASEEDPVKDYETLRRELWLYNPEYTTRPHLVALNKVDLPEVSLRLEGIIKGIEELRGLGVREEVDNDGSKPVLDFMEGQLAGGTGRQEATKRGRTTLREKLLSGDQKPSLPHAIVPISAREGVGIKELLVAVRQTLGQKMDLDEQKNSGMGDGDVRLRFDAPQWQL